MKGAPCAPGKSNSRQHRLPGAKRSLLEAVNEDTVPRDLNSIGLQRKVSADVYES